jgi:hypothetical protein
MRAVEVRWLALALVLCCIVALGCVPLGVASSTRGPWDQQGAFIVLDRGVYWSNDTLHIQVCLTGNWSNTLYVWLEIDNDTGAVFWRDNWQSNATLLAQQHNETIALGPNATVGHYTVYVTWDHRMTSTDFWIVDPVAATSLPETGSVVVVLFLGVASALCLVPRRRSAC